VGDPYNNNTCLIGTGEPVPER